ncbi:MAG: VWA domain-containing protein [Okeania sp. SIO2D1]|nr:VWA domain-containing protein [Okeania sp. SIO2D1]
MPVSIEIIERDAPRLIDLAKKADISILKANLTNHRAKVALCLDISGSMSFLYSSGKIQTLAEKILALGCRFDDNGSIDIFLFGQNPHQVGEMTFGNFHNFIPNIEEEYPLETGTYYGKAMKMIRNFYFPEGKGDSRNSPFTADKPIYVMFVTDGATSDEEETQNQLKWSSFEPIFWQFMAIGKPRKDVSGEGLSGFVGKALATDFSFLEKLDEMKGYTDNAAFFNVEDPESISDDKLYDLLMTEYPGWVKLAHSQHLLK